MNPELREDEIIVSKTTGFDEMRTARRKYYTIGVGAASIIIGAILVGHLVWMAIITMSCRG